MNKIILLLSVLFYSHCIFSQITVEDSWGKVIESKSEYIKLKLQDDFEYLISSKKFTSDKEAMDFCTKQKMKLDTQGIALFFAMSGAANSNKLINEAISFSFDTEEFKESGIWFWVGRDNKILILKNGGGLLSDVFTVEQFEKLLNKKPELPAICILIPKKIR